MTPSTMSLRESLLGHQAVSNSSQDALIPCEDSDYHLDIRNTKMEGGKIEKGCNMEIWSKELRI